MTCVILTMRLVGNRNNILKQSKGGELLHAHHILAQAGKPSSDTCSSVELARAGANLGFRPSLMDKNKKPEWSPRLLDGSERKPSSSTRGGEVSFSWAKPNNLTLHCLRLQQNSNTLLAVSRRRSMR